MADKILKSIKFPGLEDTYVIPDPTDEIDAKVSEAETDMLSVLSGATAVQTLSNTTPYLFRQTPKAGHSEFDTLVGGSVAWNQLAGALNNANWRVRSDTGSGVFSNGEVTITATAAFASLVTNGSYPIEYKAGHKYFIFANVKASAARGLRRVIVVGSTYKYGETKTLTTSWSDYTSVYSATADSSGDTIFEVHDSASGDTISIRNIQVFDLTQMFGSTVADAIYAMEQATAGSGVAYFRSLFGEDYYAYNAGELKSVEGVSAHVMRDADENIIGSYPLDSTLTLRGIPKWNNGLYYDGDVYEADGMVSRKYGIVSGSAVSAVGYSSSAQCNYADITLPSTAHYNGGLITTRYEKIDSDTTGKNGGAKLYQSAITIYDSRFTDLATARSLLTNENFVAVYELATPTTETAQPYQKAQICDPSGTEEYVSTSIVPVGHETEYPMTITDIAPTSNGTYTLKCTVSGGVATYEWASA